MFDETLYDDLIAALSDYINNPPVQIALIFLGAFFVQRLIRRYIGRIVKRAVKSHKYESRKVERQREDTLIGILSTASAAVVWLITIILSMGAIGVNIAAVATGAGLIGVVVGFGAQNTIKDFLAGIFIIAENQYRVGDIVTIADKSGVVEDITIRITRLRDLDGYVHIIPNGQITYVTNMTYQFANVNLNIGVAYDTDVDKLKDIINDVGKKMASQDAWKDQIIEPVAFLRVDSFDDSAVTVKALGKVAPGSQWEIAGEYRRQLKAAFEEKGIEIPFPQRVVHMVSDKKS